MVKKVLLSWKQRVRIMTPALPLMNSRMGLAQVFDQQGRASLRRGAFLLVPRSLPARPLVVP